MATPINVPKLYRHILKAAARFPSVKRNAIIQDIKSEFHGNKELKDTQQIQQALKVAVDGLVQVLFCTRHFPAAFQFTKEALQHDQGIEVMACDEGDLAQHLHDAHIAVPYMARLDDKALACAKDLRMVIQYGVGVETVDIPAATARGVWVSNIPSAGIGNALSCAEHAFFLILALLRQANQMQESVANRQIGHPLGQTLYGKTVLCLGYGNIAKELLPRLKAFGARTVLVRSRPQPADGSCNAHTVPHVDVYGAGPAHLPRLLPLVDIVALTCSQTESTQGIVSHGFLQHCKPGVQVVNVCRGGLLDRAAIEHGLASGHIGGLGLDVAWQEPLDPCDAVFAHPRVVTTPHVAGVTELSYRNMADRLAAEVRRIKQGLPPTIQLNKI